MGTKAAPSHEVGKVSSHTYRYYRAYDAPPCATLEIPVLTLILHSIRRLILTNKEARRAYIYTISSKRSSSEDPRSLSKIILGVFRDDFPRSIDLVDLPLHQYGVTFTSDYAPPRIFLAWNFAQALSKIDLSLDLTNEEHNLIVLAGITLHRELGIYVRGVVLGHDREKPAVVYRRASDIYLEKTDSHPPPSYVTIQDPDFGVDAELFGGLLCPTYRPEHVSGRWFVDGFIFIKEVSGIYYDLTFFLLTPLSLERLVAIWLGRIPLERVSLKIQLSRDVYGVTLVGSGSYGYGPKPYVNIIEKDDGSFDFNWGGTEVPARRVESSRPSWMSSGVDVDGDTVMSNP